MPLVDLTLAVRDLEPSDLTDLEWSGGSEHVRAVADALSASYSGEVALLAVTLPNDRLVGLGAVDFRRSPDAGLIWMLSVHERLQGVGIGTLLVRELEQRIRATGRDTARLTVEQDNPRAAALYRRLGYAEVGSALECWPTGGGRTYVTVTTVLERPLAAREPVARAEGH
jgi:ribosomal protein S18 acetylase RimI-like enzyme